MYCFIWSLNTGLTLFTFSAVCHNFLCGDGSCILDSMVCNNFQECPDDTDEVICGNMVFITLLVIFFNIKIEIMPKCVRNADIA